MKWKIFFVLLLFLNIKNVSAKPVCTVLSVDEYETMLEMQILILEMELDYLIESGDPKEEAKKKLIQDLKIAEKKLLEIDLLNSNQVMMCVQSADVVTNSSTWSVDGGIGIKFSKFLELISFNSNYSKQSNIVRNVYTCKNTETGELFQGTMDEVISWHNKFLERR